MNKPNYSHTVIQGEFEWSKINCLPADCWFADSQDALTQANAVETGESFICGDGKIKLIPCTIDEDTNVEDQGYLVEFL